MASALLFGCAPQEDTGQGDTGKDVWNFERVGTARTADGDIDLGAYSKIGGWP